MRVCIGGVSIRCFDAILSAPASSPLLFGVLGLTFLTDPFGNTMYDHQSTVSDLSHHVFVHCSQDVFTRHCSQCLSTVSHGIMRFLSMRWAPCNAIALPTCKACNTLVSTHLDRIDIAAWQVSVDNIDADLFGRNVRGGSFQPSDDTLHAIKSRAFSLLTEAYDKDMVRLRGQLAMITTLHTVKDISRCGVGAVLIC